MEADLLAPHGMRQAVEVNWGHVSEPDGQGGMRWVEGGVITLADGSARTQIGGRMPREFTSQKALRNHAELTGYVHLWEGTHAFTTRQRLLSADQYEIVDVRTDRGMTRAMLFRKQS